MPTSDKPRHRRGARAQALVRFGHHAQADSQMPSVLESARVAGVMAARRAPKLLPYTQSAELSSVEVEFEWDGIDLHISAEAAGFSRAGLGSRALLAAQICATTIVDMLDGQAEAITVEQARVVEQTGGLDDSSYRFDPSLQAAVISVSDAVAGGHKQDRAGAIVEHEVVRLADFGVELAEHLVIGDDAEAIEDAVRRLIAAGVDLVLTVGGTGLAHTDVTVETIEPMLDRPIPGIMEAARAHGQEMTPVAFMSRGVAGLVDETLVVTLPGSRGGAKESCAVLFPAVLHVFKTIRKSREMLE
ncbi:MAG: molybdopterin-binding protein [Persicimonas sp.]